MNELGVKAKGYRSNAADFIEAQKLVDLVLKDFGTVNVLVNNAGITKDNLLMRIIEEDFDKVIEVNLKSVFNMTKAIQRTFLKQRSGSLIHMSSVVGLKGNAGQSNYAASKAGVSGFTRALCKELGGVGITVNSVAPGLIRTSMTETIPDKIFKKKISEIPVGRIGTPEDVGYTCLFLASKEAGFISGITLHTNGGVMPT